MHHVAAEGLVESCLMLGCSKRYEFSLLHAATRPEDVTVFPFNFCIQVPRSYACWNVDVQAPFGDWKRAAIFQTELDSRPTEQDEEKRRTSKLSWSFTAKFQPKQRARERRSFHASKDKIEVEGFIGLDKNAQRTKWETGKELWPHL